MFAFAGISRSVPTSDERLPDICVAYVVYFAKNRYSREKVPAIGECDARRERASIKARPGGLVGNLGKRIPIEACSHEGEGEVIGNGTTGNDESVYHHADQYVDRVRSLGRFKHYDSFDPSC